MHKHDDTYSYSSTRNQKYHHHPVQHRLFFVVTMLHNIFESGFRTGHKFCICIRTTKYSLKTYLDLVLQRLLRQSFGFRSAIHILPKKKKNQPLCIHVNFQGASGASHLTPTKKNKYENQLPI